MSKPILELSRWGSAQTNDVAPTSPMRGTGQVYNTPMVSSYYNHILYQHYLWAKYINDGLWQGDIEIDGTLSVSGDLNVTSSAAISGNLAIGGDMSGDNLTLEGTLFVDTITTNHEDFIDIEAAVSAYRYYFTQAETYWIGPSAFKQTASAHTLGFTEAIVAASTNKIYAPIFLPVGSKITGFSWNLAKNTNGSSEVKASIVSLTGTVEAGHGSTASSTANAPGNFNLVRDLAALGEEVTIFGGATYYVMFESTGSITPAADRLRACSVSWIKPPPG